MIQNSNIPMSEIHGSIMVGPQTMDYSMVRDDRVFSSPNFDNEDHSVVIVGLDGTLANNSHRLDAMKAGDFDLYDSQAPYDDINSDVAEVVNCLATWHRIVIVSDRKEHMRELTNRWLVKHRVDVDAVLMRPLGNYDKTPDLFTNLLTGYIGPLETVKRAVLVAFETKEQVLETYRTIGIPTWQVR